MPCESEQTDGADRSIPKNRHSPIARLARFQAIRPRGYVTLDEWGRVVVVWHQYSAANLKTARFRVTTDLNFGDVVLV